MEDNMSRKICPENVTMMIVTLKFALIQPLSLSLSGIGTNAKYQSSVKKVTVYIKRIPGLLFIFQEGTCIHMRRVQQVITLETALSSCDGFCCGGARCKSIGGQTDATSFHRYVRTPDRTSPAHKMRVEKHHYNCDVVVEMTANSTVDFLQV